MLSSKLKPFITRAGRTPLNSFLIRKSLYDRYIVVQYFHFSYSILIISFCIHFFFILIFYDNYFIFVLFHPRLCIYNFYTVKTFIKHSFLIWSPSSQNFFTEIAVHKNVINKLLNTFFLQMVDYFISFSEFLLYFIVFFINLFVFHLTLSWCPLSYIIETLRKRRGRQGGGGGGGG